MAEQALEAARNALSLGKSLTTRNAKGFYLSSRRDLFGIANLVLVFGWIAIIT